MSDALDAVRGAAARPPTIDEIRSRLTLTVQETALALNCGRDTTYAAIERGEIPSLRLGRRIVVPAQALLALLGATPDMSVPAAPPAGITTESQSATKQLGRLHDDTPAVSRPRDPAQQDT